ncbi:MAG: TonB-dependent receptor [Vicinamibacteria bacterium]|nr:TonB-dependent receptor [Vicinamibacteria bacterium]
MRRILAIAAMLLLTTSGLALAQGVNSGVIAGKVESSDGQLLPGVTVTLTSPAMIGERTTTSDAFGGYIFKALAPGEYTVEFKKDGFASMRYKIDVRLGADMTQNAEMGPAQVEETIEVTAPSLAVIESTQVGANYNKSLIDTLPMGRTPAAIAELAPGLTDNTPNTGQVTIAGNFAYDNLILVNGVDIADELFGNDVPLYVEEAIDETQILTSGITAEYGRFGGGVINIITKSGGNDFSGSFRTVFSNPAWINETPVEKERGTEREDKISKHFEATMGGPVVKDRLWFFLAGRSVKRDNQVALDTTGLPLTEKDDEQRLEAKMTGNIHPNHRVQAAYTKRWRERFRRTFTWTATPKGTYTGEYPLSLFVVSYHGALRNNVFTDWQYSQKTEGFRNSGGSDTNIRTGSPFIGLDPQVHYGPPYFDATDPEDRDNKQLAGSLSYFLSTEKLGNHDFKLGFERYQGILRGGNSQSPTNYVFWTQPAMNEAGEYLFTADDDLVPTFTPEDSYMDHWLSDRGAELKITTAAFYLHDKWRFNKKLTFDVGARMEIISGSSSGGLAKPVDTTTLVPRLGATYDVKGDGRYTLQATYAHYAGKVTTGQFGRTSTAGNPAGIYLYYVGPAGQGWDFAPGFDPDNYAVYGGGFPTANIFFEDGLGAPITREWTLQAGTALGNKGWAKVAYVNRSIGNFVEDFILYGDQTDVIHAGEDYGTFTNQRFRNSDLPARDYQGLQFMTSYQLTSAWMAAGHWTVQLKNEGNFEGEAANQPGISTVIGDYPEFFNQARHYPVGRLDDFQRHKVRLWTTYDLDLKKFGRIAPSLMYKFNSASTYSLNSSRVPLTGEQKALDPGYPDPPTYQKLYYAAGRGSEFYEPSHIVDFAIHYDVPVFRTLRPWIKAELFNALDAHPLISYNTTVTPKNDGPKDELGLPTDYVKGANFGKGQSTDDYPTAREFRLMMGFRF